MKSSPSGISESGWLRRLLDSVWRLALIGWVGGLAMLYLAVAPALTRAGLAPMLVSEALVHLVPRMMLVAVSAAGVLTAILLLRLGWRAAVADARAWLLLVALISGLGYAYAARSGLFWPLLGTQFLILSIGLILAVQPPPQAARRV